MPSDLPYALPSAANYNERMRYVLAASREIDDFCNRKRRGLMLWRGTETLDGNAGSRYRFAHYPIYEADSVISGTTSVSSDDWTLVGDEERIVCFDDAQDGVVKVTGTFGYGHRVRVADVESGQSLTADAASFGSVFGSIAAPQAGEVYEIDEETMYWDGTRLVRGANGTAAAAHAQGTLYALQLPDPVQEATLVISQRLEALRARARDRDAPTPQEAAQLTAGMRQRPLLEFLEAKLMSYRYNVPGIVWGAR